MKTIVVYIADRLICCVTFQKNLVHINGIYQKVKLSSLNICQIMSVLQKAKQIIHKCYDSHSVGLVGIIELQNVIPNSIPICCQYYKIAHFFMASEL